MSNFEPTLALMPDDMTKSTYQLAKSISWQVQIYHHALDTLSYLSRWVWARALG